MKISDLMETLSQMEMLTGKQCGAYICGKNTYRDLLESVHAPMKEAGEHMCMVPSSVAGVRIYQSLDAPDNGKFYPADYLEIQ